VVRAVRNASKSFMALQASRYASANTSGASNDDNHDYRSNEEAAASPLIMHTKTPIPQQDNYQCDVSRIPPSVWSELYCRAVVGELPDTPSKCLWSFVSTVLKVLEHSGTADEVNASAAIVEWSDRCTTNLSDVDALLIDLRRTDPLHHDKAVWETIGLSVLDRVDDAFLTGHFEVAATLIDALLTFLRRGRSALLSAEVETALADVKRLLATAFHDVDSHNDLWLRGANALLQEHRILLMEQLTGGANDGESRSTMDLLVGELCKRCLEMLLIITDDAVLLAKRCHDSHRSAVDFLVAVCAIMEPYASLPNLASIYAHYVGGWLSDHCADNVAIDDGEADGTGIEERGLHQRWYYECIQAVLEAESVLDVVGAMEKVAKIVAEAFPHTAARHGSDRHHDVMGEACGSINDSYNEDSTADGDNEDEDDAVSDTVNLSEIMIAGADGATALTESTQARRFVVACMTAHIADVCAPAVIAASAEEIHLTFTRNNLLSAYTELFAFHSRTWRVAGLYACYSPLINPRFLMDVVEGVAPLAAAEESTYLSLLAFFHTSWWTHSDHQIAVRATLETILPGNPTVDKWWAAMDFCYAEAYRKVHRYIIATLFHEEQWARAARLAVETGLTDALHSHLRRILTSADALTSVELYAIGCAVHRGFIGVDSCQPVELARYMCAAASVAAYRQAATTAKAALDRVPHAQVGSGAVESVVRATANCLQAIEAALQRMNECEAMVHPVVTFTLVEHGAELLMTLRRLMRDPVTGDTTTSMNVPSCMLPLLMEAYQLSAIHFGCVTAPALAERSRALNEKLANVHQACIGHAFRL
jgi:hypothetical protein